MKWKTRKESGRSRARKYLRAGGERSATRLLSISQVTVNPCIVHSKTVIMSYLVQGLSHCKRRVIDESAPLTREGALICDLVVPLGLSDRYAALLLEVLLRPDKGYRQCTAPASRPTVLPLSQLCLAARPTEVCRLCSFEETRIPFSINRVKQVQRTRRYRRWGLLRDRAKLDKAMVHTVTMMYRKYREALLRWSEATA